MNFPPERAAGSVPFHTSSTELFTKFQSPAPGQTHCRQQDCLSVPESPIWPAEPVLLAMWHEMERALFHCQTPVDFAD